MKYGYFDDARREYVITNPKTPVKWINYVGTLAFGGFVDHTGGALICRNDPALNRILKYIPQLPASEFNGETLYLRFRQKRSYKVFSPYFVPTLDPYASYECRVGLGYTRLTTEFYRVRTEVAIFVPRDGQVLLRDITVTNLGDEPLSLDLIPVVEYTHPDALKQLTNADWVPQTMQSRAERDPSGCVTLAQYPFMYRDTQVNYFTSNHPAGSFETDRQRFLGDHEYGTWARPLALQQDELANSEARRGNNIAGLLHHLGELGPGESRRVITQLGQAGSLAEARPSIERYRDPAHVTEAFGQLGEFWDDYLGRLQVRTPDPSLNRMLNIHNARQCYITKTWSRYLSLYQLGYGARGLGFRDSSQDVLGILAGAPGEAKALMRQLLSVQRRDGSAMHQFNPLSMEASAGDAREREDRPQYYSDDHLWIVLAVTAYLKETGDLDFLDEGIPYYEKDKAGQPLETGSVMGHLRRALDFTSQDLGVHGLPRLGFADWNDTINLAAGAESLLAANLYGRALSEMIELAEYRGDHAAAAGDMVRYARMKSRVNETAWDGEWYVAYFDADGAPLGSRTNAHGQIHLNAQSWPVLSGFAPAERAEAALRAAHERLNTRFGLKLSAPGYNGFDPSQGGVTTYPPGAKENGGIFLHANPWIIIAEALRGNGDQAYADYAQINPAAQNDRLDEYECEPYAYPQNILGDEHPQFGLARNSWLSGTASWMYQAGTQYLLGLQPTYVGLRIDPCLPHAWDGFSATRHFRGGVYHLTVRNPEHVCRGVKCLKIDGREVQGNTIPVLDGEHEVEVVLGATQPG